MDETEKTSLSNTLSIPSMQESDFVHEDDVNKEVEDAVDKDKKKKSKKKKKNNTSSDDKSPDSTTASNTDTGSSNNEAALSNDNLTHVPERGNKAISFAEDIQRDLDEIERLGYEDVEYGGSESRSRSEDGSGYMRRSFQERRHSYGERPRKNSFFRPSTASSAARFSYVRRSGDMETYPPDVYSFIAIHNPFRSPFFFLFGFTVWVFQVMFLLYMILNKLHTNLGLNGEVDNPGEDFVANFIPANVTELVRATQITAVLSYCMFADSSIKDCACAVEQFPRFDRAKKGDGLWLVVFSCFLRFTQGLLAIFATFLLIVTTSDVIEIILNFAAINFISTLDEVAFDLAKWGKYGPALEKEARSIENRPIPYCIYRKYKHVRYYMTVAPIAIVLVASAVAISVWQESENYWVTQILRVQFQDSTGLQPYSGCYLLDPEIRHNKRKNYNSFEDNPKAAIMGYCKETRQWRLFKNEGDSDEEGGERNDPCMVSREYELAHSGRTDYFDISSSFDDSWFSASGTPLDLYFFESDVAGIDLEEECPSFLNNGKCDIFFNTLGFQYDGGDCCAATCTKTNCGQDGAVGAFGSNVTEGIGFRNCIDPRMVPLTINLDRITSSRNRTILKVTKEQEDEYFREKSIEFWGQDPVTPLFVVDCDEDNILSIYVDDSMENKSETIYVKDGARCTVSVSNTTNFDKKWDNDPIWWVEYSVFHGDTIENKIVSGNSAKLSETSFHRVPECYFDMLDQSINLTTAYSFELDSTLALDWLINDKSENSKCEDDFLVERFALAALNFAAPISAGLVRGSSNSSESGYYNIMQYDDKALWIQNQRQCRWDNIACEEGSVETLAVRSKDLSGTISTSVGLLTGLRRLDYDANGMTGTIPTEIGYLTNLEGLDIDNQSISGTIPTEFGMFTKMRELDLDRNKLTGTIPTEFGLMKDANEFDLIYNELSGPIPSELGKLRKMKTFGFEGNMLSGTIPSQIGLIKSLEGVHFRINELTGPIPIQIGELDELKNLILGENSMTGTVPTEIGRLRNLLSLDLSKNNFRGPIPTEIGEMTKLTSIDLRGNAFTGKIPSELGYLTDLVELRLEDNNFIDVLPLEVTMIERLRIITADENVNGDFRSSTKTLNPCFLCNGEPYDLAENNDQIIFAERGEFGEVIRHSCRSLLQDYWKYPFELFSEDACNILREDCIVCGSGPYFDSFEVTKLDNDSKDILAAETSFGV